MSGSVEISARNWEKNKSKQYTTSDKHMKKQTDETLNNQINQSTQESHDIVIFQMLVFSVNACWSFAITDPFCCHMWRILFVFHAGKANNNTRIKPTRKSIR